MENPVRQGAERVAATAAPVLGVGAVVLRASAPGEEHGALEVLLIRRGRPPAKGTWSLPGGRVERGERLVDAAAREVLEETAVAVDVHELVEVVELVTEEFHYVIMDYRATPRPDAEGPRAGDDADDARWVALDALAAYGATEAVRRVVGKAVALHVRAGLTGGGA